MPVLRLLALLSALALSACEPGVEPTPPPSDDTGGGAGGDGAEAAAITLSFAPGAPPQGATAVDLDVAAVALFGREPSWQDANTPCDAGVAAALSPLAERIEVPFGGGQVPFFQAETPSGGELREVWLVVRRGTLRTAERTYDVHAERLCTMPDGLLYLLLRARPRAVLLPGAREVALDLGREQLLAEQVDCRVFPGVEECATADDGTDADPETRLRWAFAPELPARTAGPSR